MKKLIAALIGGYAAACAILFLLQDRLLFFPRPNDSHSVALLADHQWSTDSGGFKLTGWVLERANAEHFPLVIYFGGNAQDVSQQAVRVWNHLNEANLLLMNYRGFGSSQGKPGERELFEDALHIYDDARSRLRHNDSIIAWGRSLGSGVATYLAANREIDGIILVTPFDSVLAVAEANYGFFPVQWLLRHRFDSVARAPHITAPALIFIAGRDRIVPPHHAERLVDAWGGQTRIVRIEDATHASIGADAAFFKVVAEWLTQFAVP